MLSYNNVTIYRGGFMYSAQELSNRIKYMAKKKNIVVSKMLSECGLNPNTLNQISEERGLSSFSLAKIADCLGCSVDYLLCRTENSEAHKTNANISNTPITDEQLAVLIDTYDKLDTIGKARLLVMADEIVKEKK